MKIYLIIIGYIVAIACTYYLTNIYNDISDFKLESLEKENDSLYNNLKLSNIKLEKLDSLSDTINKELEVTKTQLTALQVKSKKLKQQYESENKRINTMSNTTVISEFTNAFK
jgi:hypothetical protein